MLRRLREMVTAVVKSFGVPVSSVLEGGDDAERRRKVRRHARTVRWAAKDARAAARSARSKDLHDEAREAAAAQAIG